MSSSPEWLGENPFYLLKLTEVVVDIPGAPPITTQDQLVVDIDQPGWVAEHGRIFREEGDLHLVRKSDDTIIFSVRLHEGEQGYYFARRIRTMNAPGEAVAYTIGKKQVDGVPVNLWYLHWGQVCGGQDVEHFAIAGLRAGRGQV